jgi:hypothetical protein
VDPTIGKGLQLALGTAGTAIYANAATGYSGNFIDLRVNAVSVFSVNQAGVETNAGQVVNGTSTLNGNVTISANNNFIQNGTGTFGTGTGAVSLNGNVTIAANNTFIQNGTGTFGTGTGAVSLRGNTTVTGANTFSTGTGAVTVNGAATFVLGPATFGSTTPVHIVSKQTTAPTAARSGNGAGAAGVCSIVSGTDTAGILQVVTAGAGEVASTAMCTVTFNAAYGVAPVVVMTTALAPAASQAAGIETFVSATGTTTFSVSSGAIALADVATYQWYYIVIGK